MKQLTQMDPEKLKLILSRVPFFREFSPAERERFQRQHANFLVAEEGETIIKQHSVDSSFYILLHGAAGVYLGDSDRAVDMIDPGQFFGEIAFLQNSLRTSHVVARERCILFRMDREVMDELGCEIREKVKDRIIDKLVGIVSSYNALLQEQH